MASAVFNYSVWSALFPDLAGKVNAGQAQAYFDLVGTLYVDNSDASVITDVNTRLALLNLAVAHFAQINLPASAGGTGIVGRVSSATEGSVSVASQLTVPGSAAWWSQTPFGLSVWQALQGYRTMQYVPAPSQPDAITGLPLGTLYFGGRGGINRW